MAKRFTDTDKWKKPWFCKLPVQGKFVWSYLLDNCDHAGVWSENYELMSFQVGYQVTKDDLIGWFGEKLFFFDEDKVFIQSFVDFQYGELKSTNNAHKKVLDTLLKIKHYQPLKSPYLGAQDKDKDKDKSKEKEEEEAAPQIQENSQNHNAIDLIKPNPTVAFQLRMSMPEHVAIMDEFKIPLVKYHKHMGRIVERFPDAKDLREAVENICSTKVYLDLKKSGTQVRRDSYFFKAFDKEIGAV